MKKVSIVMCTYNGESFLREQLDSLVNQTYPIYELIVQDDKSTDNTISILREYQIKYSEIKIDIYVNSEQLGYRRNFLTAYQKATGDLIASCDQDDIWELTKLEILTREIEDCLFMYHNSFMFNERERLGNLFTKKLPAYPSSLHTLLMPHSYGHQILFKKEMLSLLRDFQTYELSYDYFLNTLSGCVGKVKYLDEVLVYWRRHNSATTYSEEKQGSDIKLFGYYKALCSLFYSKNREITKQYFALCSKIDTQNKEVNDIIHWLSTGSLICILKACLLCLKHRKELVPDKLGIIQYVRAFFIPLFFIRDYGNYILISK